MLNLVFKAAQNPPVIPFLDKFSTCLPNKSADMDLELYCFRSKRLQSVFDAQLLGDLPAGFFHEPGI